MPTETADYCSSRLCSQSFTNGDSEARRAEAVVGFFGGAASTIPTNYGVYVSSLNRTVQRFYITFSNQDGFS